MSKDVDKTLNYMKTGRGKIPASIYYALSCEPLRWRTFGNLPVSCGELNESHLEKFFSPSYLITMVTAGVVNQFLHAEGTTQTLYTDKYVSDYFKSHGLNKCGIWDFIDTDTLAPLSPKNHDFRWAYSAAKPLATLKEIEKAKHFVRNGKNLPLLFHDTDLVMRQSYDKILNLNSATDIPMAFGHLEEIELTEFYPKFDKLHLTEKFQLANGKLIHLPSERIYRTDLPAVNTCLMYFSDYDLATEWAEIFHDMMEENFFDNDDYTWIKGEQILLACDQRTGLMVTERRGLKFLEQVKSFLPISWAGDRFVDISTRKNTEKEWHYYRPDYADPNDEKKAAIYLQQIHHLWNQKSDLEKHVAFANFLGLFDLQLIRGICTPTNISWFKLEESLRSFPTLKNYFSLLDTGRTIEDLLEEERLKPVEKRIIDNKLIKNLNQPLTPEL